MNAVDHFTNPAPTAQKEALNAITALNGILSEAEDLSLDDDSLLHTSLERLHRSALHVSRTLVLIGLRKGVSDIHEFLSWSRYYCGNEPVSILVNEDAHFGSAFEQARGLENLLRETPTGSTQVRLDREGYWKIVAFTLTNGEWRAAARGFRVVHPIRVPVQAGRAELASSQTAIAAPRLA